jgi:hypothetical protein
MHWLIQRSSLAKAASIALLKACNQETGLSSNSASTMQERQSTGPPARLATRAEQTALARVTRPALWSSS